MIGQSTPDRPFYNFRVLGSGDDCVKFRNVVCQISKFEKCERVGRALAGVLHSTHNQSVGWERIFPIILSPTDLFTVSEPRQQYIGEFHFVHERLLKRPSCERFDRVAAKYEDTGKVKKQTTHAWQQVRCFFLYKSTLKIENLAISAKK